MQISKMQIKEIKEKAKNDYNITERECEVWALLAFGLDNTEIGKKLIISPTTVCTHLVSLRQKLEIFSAKKSTQRVKMALKFLTFSGFLQKEWENE